MTLASPAAGTAPAGPPPPSPPQGPGRRPAPGASSSRAACPAPCSSGAGRARGSLWGHPAAGTAAEGAEGEPGRRSGPRAGRSGACRLRLPRRSAGRARRPQAPWAVSVRLTFRLPSLEQSPPGGTKGVRRTRLPTGEEMRSGDGNQPDAAPTPPPSAGARAFAVGGPGGCPGWPRLSGATQGRGRGAGA